MAHITSCLIAALKGRYKVERKLGAQAGLSLGTPHTTSPEHPSPGRDLSARVGRP